MIKKINNEVDNTLDLKIHLKIYKNIKYTINKFTEKGFDNLWII